ncbi:hypothetical protein HDU76_009890, partial [Blyttiomyces sp. JEL0837]
MRRAILGCIVPRAGGTALLDVLEGRSFGHLLDLYVVFFETGGTARGYEHRLASLSKILMTLQRLVDKWATSDNEPSQSVVFGSTFMRWLWKIAASFWSWKALALKITITWMSQQSSGFGISTGKSACHVLLETDSGVAIFLELMQTRGMISLDRFPRIVAVAVTAVVDNSLDVSVEKLFDVIVLRWIQFASNEDLKIGIFWDCINESLCKLARYRSAGGRQVTLSESLKGINASVAPIFMKRVQFVRNLDSLLHMQSMTLADIVCDPGVTASMESVLVNLLGVLNFVNLMLFMESSGGARLISEGIFEPMLIEYLYDWITGGRHSPGAGGEEHRHIIFPPLEHQTRTAATLFLIKLYKSTSGSSTLCRSVSLTKLSECLLVGFDCGIAFLTGLSSCRILRFVLEGERELVVAGEGGQRNNEFKETDKKSKVMLWETLVRVLSGVRSKAWFAVAEEAFTCLEIIFEDVLRKTEIL